MIGQVSTFTVLVIRVCIAESNSRNFFDLDGEWSFKLSAPALSGKIQVPGSWEAQRYGIETAQMRWQVVTGDNAHGTLGAIGVYEKVISNITCPVSGSKKFLAIDHGIHRTANITMAGVFLARHKGYLTPLEIDVTKYLPDNGSGVLLEISLSGGREPKSDPLMGAADLDTDGTGLGGWAGLNGHVSIQCRPPLRIDSGIANTLPPQVRHEPVQASHAGGNFRVNVTFTIVGGPGVPTLMIVDNGGQTVASVDGEAAHGTVTMQVDIPAVQLWTPDTPSLYMANVLLREPTSQSVVDSVQTRFGVRTISTEGHKFMLNGRRLFLNGYGDDAMYPHTVSPPRKKEPYEAKLKFARAHGFNFVRHHSHVLPDEYFAAADEHGMLISPELPCAYGKYYRAADATGKELYKQTWQSYISRLRNHPSVMDWAMCNEYNDGIDMRQELYDIAKSLDVSRLVIDADGVFGWRPGSFNRSTLDFHSIQFDVQDLGSWGSLPLGKPFKYYDECSGPSCKFNSTPLVPAISHETGNFNTFPRMDALLDKFNKSGTTIKPYWLSEAREHLASLDLLKENEAWATATERLYAMCWKIDIEDLRRNPMLSGYEWWTIQDYWTGNNGLVDTFFEPKEAASSVMTQFNAPSILLQDGLQFAYQSGDTLNVTLSLSNFGEADVTPSGEQVAWEVSMCAGHDCTRVHQSSGPVKTTVPQGSLGIVAHVLVVLPDIGNISVKSAKPRTIKLVASLSPASSGDMKSMGIPLAPENSWNATLYPKWIDTATPGFNLIVTDSSLLQGCMFNNCRVDPSYPLSVYLTTHVNTILLDTVRAGSVAVLLQQNADGFYPSESTRFKQAWWLGSATDNNAGTFVYEDRSAVFDNMAPLQYADITWYRMLQDAQAFLLEEFDAHSPPDVLVRAIDISTRARNKALCFRLKVGQGYIIGSGLNLLQACSQQGCPEKEKAWVLYKLLLHAGDLMASEAQLLPTFI